MARNYYAEINLHIVWHTKESSPLLVPKVEAIVHHYLRGRCIDTSGVYIHEIGGTENHVHLCVSIAPTVLISEFIGQLKGASAHEANQKLGYKALECALTLCAMRDALCAMYALQPRSRGFPRSGVGPFTGVLAVRLQPLFLR